MLTKAVETIFFYNVEGVLRQAVQVELDNKGLTAKNVRVEITTPEHGSCITEVNGLKPGENDLTCYAPVVYPNFVDGKLRPVSARIVVSADRELYRGQVEIGRHRPWTIYICQDICTDFTWGMPYDQTMEESRGMIRAQLENMKGTDHEADESMNRWNMNQTMEVEWFVENEEKELIEELFRREKEGRVQISPTYNSNLSAMLSTEQAIRSLYYARELWKKWGIGMDTLEHIEMPTITWGMISIYAKAGIKYFTKGWLDYNSHHLRKSDDKPLFYWKGPDGNSVLTFMDKGANLRAGYGQASFLSGSLSKKIMSYGEIKDELHDWWIPHFENNEAYPFDSFMMLGAYIDLHATSRFDVKTLVNNIIRYNHEPWEYPKIVNATWKQYFERALSFANKNKIDIPVISGDMGTSWEDWPAHYAHLASEMKRGVENFITAEKMAALHSLITAKADKEELGILRASVKLMNQLAEHPWNGTDDNERHRSLAKRTFWTKELNNNNAGIMEGFCKKVFGSASRIQDDIKVLNLMSWERTDEVFIDEDRIDKNFSAAAGDRVQSVDEFGKRSVLFVAGQVPSIGYKNYKAASMPDLLHEAVRAEENVIENRYYKIAVDKYTGSIESMWDKKNECELVNDNENMGLNQYLYESDGTVHKLKNIKASHVNCGPLRCSLLIEGETLRSRVETLITLYSSIDKIKISNRIVKEPSSEPMNIYFAFPFNMPDRKYHYECTGSIIKPGLKEYGGDNIKGSGQEVYSVRNFIDVSNKDMGVVVSPHHSYLFQLGGKTYDVMSDCPDPSNATVYSLVMTNHAYIEILRNQGGNREFRFDYSLKTYRGQFDPVSSMKFGWDENNPLLAVPRGATEMQGLKADKISFIKCRADNVIVTAFKNAEDNPDEYVLRLWEIAGIDTNAEVEVFFPGFSKAVGCDIIERENAKEYELVNGVLKIPVKARSIETVKLIKRSGD